MGGHLQHSGTSTQNPLNIYWESPREVAKGSLLPAPAIILHKVREKILGAGTWLQGRAGGRAGTGVGGWGGGTTWCFSTLLGS